VDIASSVLANARVRAFLALAVAVVAWFIVAPHLPRVSLWWAIVIV